MDKGFEKKLPENEDSDESMESDKDDEQDEEAAMANKEQFRNFIESER